MSEPSEEVLKSMKVIFNKFAFQASVINQLISVTWNLAVSQNI